MPPRTLSAVGLAHLRCLRRGIHFGRRRPLRCANHVDRGTWGNVRTVARKAIEGRVLAGIKDKLLSSEFMAVFVREFTKEWSRQAAGNRQQLAVLEAELADVNCRTAQMLDAIEQGIVTATTKERLLALEAKQDELTADLAKLSEAASPPALHPSLAEVYRRKVADLETALDDASIRGDAALALRGLIDSVVLHPWREAGRSPS